MESRPKRERLRGPARVKAKKQQKKRHWVKVEPGRDSSERVPAQWAEQPANPQKKAQESDGATDTESFRDGLV